MKYIADTKCYKRNDLFFHSAKVRSICRGGDMWRP